jgi:hypothetical protein
MLKFGATNYVIVGSRFYWCVFIFHAVFVVRQASHSSLLIPENFVHLQEQTHSTNNKTWLAMIFWIVPCKIELHIIK